MITARKSFIPYLILTATVFAVYSNIYANLFLYDDENLILHNRFLQDWHYLPTLFVTSLNAGNNIDSAYYRPLQSLLYMFVVQVAGFSLFAFHFLNLALHAVNACLVYRLGLKFKFKPIAVFCAALLWALHPVQTEAVTYMSATADTLYTCFCLLGILVLLPDFTPRRISLALPFMFLALLSKEAAVIFPLLAASCFYFVNERRFELKTYMRFWPLFCLTAIYPVLHHIFLPHGIAAAQPAAAFTADYSHIAILPAYLKLLVWPVGLHMGHELAPSATLWRADIMCGIGLFVAATAQILRERTSCSLPFSWGLCWFAAALMPALFMQGAFYEHWLYLPSVGLFLGMAQSVALFVEKKSLPTSQFAKQGIVIATLLVAAVMGFLTYNQNTIWRESVVFYEHIFAQGEKAAKAHGNLATVYMQQGEYEKAVEQNRIAIENSHDTLATARVNLALALYALPDGQDHQNEVLANLQRALEIDPDFYGAFDALAHFYNQQKNPEKSAFYRDKADAVRKKFRTFSDGQTAF